MAKNSLNVTARFVPVWGAVLLFLLMMTDRRIKFELLLEMNEERERRTVHD